MIIKWLKYAINDLQELRLYITNQANNITANKVVESILYVINLLSEQPGMGRPGRVLNTRELVISGTPYIVPYRIKNEIVEILRVFHAAMQWPKKL